MIALHDIVAVPELVRLDGETGLQLSPRGTVAVRVTVPENWLRNVMTIVEFPGVPAMTERGDVAETSKSVTLKMVLAE